MDAEKETAQPGDDRPTATMLKMPRMIYGTAWKEERTAELVYQAIRAGFRGIDTAAMRRHYDEKLTGEGIRRAIADGLVKREDLYIQTKFTPGDPAFADADRYPTIAAQVHASVAASLAHLAPSSSSSSSDGDGDEQTQTQQSSYIDCLVLHSPFDSAADTLAAWTALAAFVPGRVRTLGISNVTLPDLEALYDATTTTTTTTATTTPAVSVPISVVQNRFRRAERAWDVDVRAFCAARGIAYQAFWTLTGTPAEWEASRYVGRVAHGAGTGAGVGRVGRAAAWYALLQAAGLVVLNGTTDAAHMRADLEGVEKVNAWRTTEEGGKMFEACLEVFRQRVG